MDVFVVSHTHWDREWYHGAGRFRQRLVVLVDELLDTPPADAVPFLLDGQAMVLDDYLAVRPERADALAAALRDGRLEAGPWYVLADELIPGGESLVRNLLAGRRALRRLGATAPPVLYSPDAFGHPAALPAIAAGFGLPLVIVWRGYGGRRWPAGDLARWHAPDGNATLLHHLPPAGYEFGSNLPVDPADARQRWAEMRGVLAPRTRTDALLVLNGADHHALQRDAAAAFDALRAAAAPTDRLHRATLAGFAREVVRRAEPMAPPAVSGELRDSYGYAWTLQGTFATRAHQKRAAAAVERMLVRDTEPWLALAPQQGGASARAGLAAAWHTLLLCHPHDTLCGCATDSVAHTMDARLADAAEQATGLREDAIAALVGHDPTAARPRRASWQPVLVARNAAARPREGVAEIELLAFAADVGVGPGSAPVAPDLRRPTRPYVDGGRVLIQPLADALVHHRVESPRHYPDNDLVRHTRALAWLPPVAGYGTHAFSLTSRRYPGAGTPPPFPHAHAVRAAPGAITNDLLRVTVDEQGRVAVAARDGRTVQDVVGFESVGDVGDCYTHSPAGAPAYERRFLGARLVARGPLRGTLALRYAVRVPARRTRVRAAAPVTLPLTVTLSLDADAPFVRIGVRGANRAHDHRLRIILRTGVAHAAAHADAAFGPVHRERLVVPPEDAAAEQPPATGPLHRYVSLYGAHDGASVFSDGLAEYEATEAGDVLITLVRAVGELSRNDLPERPGHAGWPVPTPGAQCPGPFAAELALLLHGARSVAALDAIERVADDVLLPLRAETLRAALALPAPTAGVELVGEGLAVTAVKPGEHDCTVVLRCVNLTDDAVSGMWRIGFAVTSACQARLDEEPGAPASLDGGELRFVAPPRGIVTFCVR